MEQEKEKEKLTGILCAAGAYFLWGLLPVYWKLLHHVPPPEVLAHRIVWSFVFMLLLLLAAGRLKSFRGELREVVSRPAKFFGTVVVAALVTANWFTYIWAVSNNRVVEASLGYYINPLVSVLLGIIVLKERLSCWQLVSFFLATAGVLNLVFHFGAVPWVALILAGSFGCYGLIKKIINLGALTGVTLETMLISPFALAFLVYVHRGGGGAFDTVTPGVSALLMGAGVVTALPLILFAGGTRRLPLSVVGFLQYIAPTMMLVLGVFVYHEPFTPVHLVSFMLIWTALAIFSLSRTAWLVRLENMFLRKFTPGEERKGAG